MSDDGRCLFCQGTGQKMEGNIVVDECPHCGGSGFADHDIDDEYSDVESEI